MSQEQPGGIAPNFEDPEWVDEARLRLRQAIAAASVAQLQALWHAALRLELRLDGPLRFTDEQASDRTVHQR